MHRLNNPRFQPVRRRALRARRRAGMYIVALGASLVVTVVGVSALMAVRIENRFTGGAVDLTEARFYARSAIEIGSWIMGNDTSWRTSKTNGFWKVDQALGRGTYSLKAEDPVDGDLTDSTSDPVVLTGIGTVDAATYQLAVQFSPYGAAGMDCLASAVHTATYVDVLSTLTVNAPLSSNGNVNVANSGTVNGSVEAVSSINQDGIVTGTATTPIAAKEIPTSTVFDYYVSQAVEIPYSSLTGGVLDKTLLTPGSNPFGATHAKGLYLVRCNGAAITIRNSRIHGTLVVLDAATGSRIDGPILCEAYESTWPALLIRGQLDLKGSGTLSETSNNTNFNPPGSPYQGSENTTTTDSYPNLVKGLVYVSGSLQITGPQTIEGVLVTGGSSLTVNQPLTVTHNSTYLTTPPPGFERAYRPMATIAGTWQQVVD